MSTATQHVLAKLPENRETSFEILGDATLIAQIKKALDLLDLRKLRFTGAIVPQTGRDWMLRGTLGATAVQPCVVTLAPVTPRVDMTVERFYIADFEHPEDSEAEMPEDDRIEPLPVTLDLITVLTEALSLALPDFPRADGAELGSQVYAADGVAPMTDEDAKPFAGLASLKAKLTDPKN
jgi:uncharacterized metal-binding protein YceD (DUF177 family)